MQGNRTAGITEKPSGDFLNRLQEVFGFTPPRAHGHDAVQAMQAMVRGTAKALICLGGNLAVAIPDPELCFTAMKRLRLSVHLGTKLNRSHLLMGGETYLLPALGAPGTPRAGRPCSPSFRACASATSPGRRDVLFMNAEDLAAHGLAHGDRVDIETVSLSRRLLRHAFLQVHPGADQPGHMIRSSVLRHGFKATAASGDSSRKVKLSCRYRRTALSECDW